MAASTGGSLSSPRVRSPSMAAFAMGPPTPQKSPASLSSTQLRPRPTKQQSAPTTTPCVDVICCDADHSVLPVPCTSTDCHDCSASAPASPCSDIHHISSACTEPTCAAATSSTSAILCSSAVACCDDTACPDVPSSPCSQADCSASGDCSSMTLAVPTISTTCCTDEGCEPELSPRLKAKVATICDGVVPSPPAHAELHTHGTGHAHRTQHNECRECRGSITSTNTAEGGHLYSSFQELLDCCCCSMPPTVEQCCVGGQGSTPYPCTTGAPHPSPAEQQVSPAGHLSHQHQHSHEAVLQPHQHSHHAHSHGPPLSDTPSSSIITNATQQTSPGGHHHRDHLHSRASTVSTTATPQPVIASPATASFPWSSAAIHSTPSESKDKYHHSCTSSFDASGVVSFEDIFPGLQSWNDCMFEQPHLHSSHGGCLPPAMTLCDSEMCQTSAPHSHWMPGSHQTSAMQSNTSQHSQHGDARPQQCQWGGCNERFWTVEELVAHVNHSHLARKNAAAAGAESVHTPTEKALVHASQQHSKQLQQMDASLQHGVAGANNSSLECLWKDCHQVPMPEKLEFDGMFTPTTEAQIWKNEGGEAQAQGQGQNDRFSLAILQHLLHDHLGQHSAPPFPLKSGEQNLVPASHPTHNNGPVTLISPSTESIPSFISKKRKNSEATSINSSGTNSTHGPLLCRWEGCSAQFDSHSALTDHIETAHVGSGKAEYECRWLGCPRHASGQKFSQKQKVLRHIQTHTGDRPFKCAECGKRFSEQNTLAQHMRTHTLERPYVCDYPGCGKAFSVAGSLTIHKRTHTGSKPFVCSFPGCGKAFAESSNLTKHVRTHTGDKPFECSDCGKRFSRPDQLGRHRKSHERKRAKVGGGAVEEAVEV